MAGRGVDVEKVAARVVEVILEDSGLAATVTEGRARASAAKDREDTISKGRMDVE